MPTIDAKWTEERLDNPNDTRPKHCLREKYTNKLLGYIVVQGGAGERLCDFALYNADGKVLSCCVGIQKSKRTLKEMKVPS